MTQKQSIDSMEALRAAIPPAFPHDDALYLAILTDSLQCGTWQALHTGAETLAWDKLLQVRLFNEAGEFFAGRDYARGEFTVRTIMDDKDGGDTSIPTGVTRYPAVFEETHLLDIDTDKGFTATPDGKTTFHTMGGGTYTLPVTSETKKVIVRTYFQSNPENGIEFPVDWRIVKFC